jgi:hypothetical protein
LYWKKNRNVRNVKLITPGEDVKMKDTKNANFNGHFASIYLINYSMQFIYYIPWNHINQRYINKYIFKGSVTYFPYTWMLWLPVS